MFLVERRKFPSELIVSLSQKHIWADGTSSVVFKVDVRDVEGEKTFFPTFATPSFGEIERADKTFILKVSRMPKSVPKARVKVSFFALGQFVLREDVWVEVSPGPPHDILVFAERKEVLGDGKDTLKVKARVIDLAGNTVFLKPSLKLSHGFVKDEKETGEGDWIFSISVTSQKDVISHITFSVADVSHTLSFKVVGFIPTFWEIGADGGVATNFGRQAVFLRGHGEVRRSLRFFSVLGGAGLGFSFFPGKNLQFSSFYLMPSVGVGKRFGSVGFDLKTHVSPAIYRFKVRFGGEENFILFGFLFVPEFSVSLRTGKRSLLSLNLLYLEHLVKPQNQFLRVRGIDLLVLSLSWSFEGAF